MSTNLYINYIGLLDMFFLSTMAPIGAKRASEPASQPIKVANAVYGYPKINGSMPALSKEQALYLSVGPISLQTLEPIPQLNNS